MSRGTVVDLFCGAGGASLGFHQAGFEIRGAVDIDEDALDTYERNLTNEGIVDFEPLQADLEETTFDEIRDHFGLEKGEVDVICGCPPCQNFSSLRDTTPWPEDEPKDDLLRAFVERIREEKPDLVFFENVQGILSSGEGAYIKWFRNQMEKVTREEDTEEQGGYGVNLKLVNAANYGIPQRRKRTIGVCVYGADPDDIAVRSPTHTENPDEDDERERWRWVQDAIVRDDLENLSKGEKQDDDPAHRARNHRQKTIDLMEAIPDDGGSWMDLRGTEHEDLIRECHQNIDSGAGSAYGRMAWKEPAPTLTTRCTTPSCGRFTHPEANRSITPREAALLMTFPREFELPDRISAAERVVGNAVPPDLVEAMLYSPSVERMFPS
jgi:DNA (cytosine-5)-methyltransferase 1